MMYMCRTGSRIMFWILEFARPKILTNWSVVALSELRARLCGTGDLLCSCVPSVLGAARGV